jgi:hypothetical protein
MPVPETRRLVAALLLAALMVAAPGCSAINPGDGGAGPSTDPTLDAVPATADIVGYVNVQGMRTDETLRKLLNETADQTDDSGESPEEMLSEFESESGLDPSGIGQATMFGRYANDSGFGDSGYFGMVVTTNWAEDDVVTAAENGSEYDLERGRYASRTIYEPVGGGEESAWLGVLDDGTYVVGSERAVKDTIDVDVGDSEAVSGTLRTTFENTENTLFRFASTVPRDQLPDSGEMSSFQKATTVAGTMKTYDNETVELSMTATFSEESAATNTRDMIEGAIALYRSGIQGDTSDLLADDHLWVTQDGTSVTVISRNAVDTLVSALEETGGAGAGPTMAVRPLALATAAA